MECSFWAFEVEACCAGDTVHAGGTESPHARSALVPKQAAHTCMRQVVDAPRFEWRGFMLDVGRHFFGVPFILRALDLAAFYRLNRFHWHLTEDQACRPALFFSLLLAALSYPSLGAMELYPVVAHHM